jgi:uncharacterized membrane protein YdbT with pleckstrin-like domain
MPYPRKHLNDYEEIAVDLNPHWLYFWEPALTLLGAIVLTILLESWFDVRFLTYVLVALVVGGALWLGWRYLTWANTHFVVTTDRLIYRSGVLSKKGVEIPLERINNVNFSQRLFERITGSGDLMIESAGKDGQQYFNDIRHPDRVQKLIHAEIEGNENRKYDRINRNVNAAAPPPPPPMPTSPIEALKELEVLHARGVLTDAEFQAQKQKLLDRL